MLCNINDNPYSILPLITPLHQRHLFRSNLWFLIVMFCLHHAIENVGNALISYNDDDDDDDDDDVEVALH